MNKKFILIVAISLLIFSLFLRQNVLAGDEHNVSGWAWSENIGWISFNNTSAGGAINYGVNINESGIFEGYAWSENIGWITFNESELSGCSQGTCKAWVEDSGQVFGWARALNHGDGWNGWIRLRDSNYGVSINKNNGEFSGWAWTDMNIGWISFNCTDRDICSTSNYKVITDFSLVRAPDAPDELSEDWNDCTPYKELSLPTFKWNYSHPDNIAQKGYQIKIYGESELDIISDIASLSYTPDRTWVRDNLLFGENEYSWQVRVEDENDNWSDWSEIKYFQTRKHAYPWIDFSWAPLKPSVDKIVQFADKSETYGDTNKESWDWNFPDANPPYSSLDNPTTTFSSAGIKSVSLEVTDSSGFSCQKSKDVTVSLPLPEYKEVMPISLLKLPRTYLNRINIAIGEQSERLSADIFKSFQHLIWKLF